MTAARQGYVQIYTGDGKGKTTAALGLIVRALGQGLRPAVLQFMKSDPSWGEIVTLKKLGVPVEQCGLDHWVFKGEASEEDLAAAAAARSSSEATPLNTQWSSPHCSTGTPSFLRVTISPQLGSDFMNCRTAGRRPWPRARTMSPRAAVVLPLPSPV